jgi:hypothetical protein
MPTRRQVLTSAAAASLAAAGLAGLPVPATSANLSPGRRRIQGHVQSAGRGIAGAVVSDGARVAATGRDGRFTLVSDADSAWLALSLPAGYMIPTSPAGPAALYRPIVADARGEARVTFDLTPDVEGQDRHRVIVMADIQTQNDFEMQRFQAEAVPAVRTAVHEGGRVIGIACGDIMYDDLTFYPAYEQATLAVGMPCFQVVGNHDLDFSARTTEASTATFRRHFGPDSYSFNLGQVHYVVLNDVLWYGDGYVGYLTERQLQWLAADLAFVEQGRTVVVALHIPLGSTRWQRTGRADQRRSETVNNKDALLELLQPYRAWVLAGHTHEMEQVRHGDRIVEQVFGAVCGAWWSGDICWDGTPNGFGVLDVRDSEVRMGYRSTGLPPESQMRLALTAAPGPQVLANVFAWNPDWTVRWHADGEARGLMPRVTDLDPRAVAEQTGPTRPARRGWVEPTPTAHLFVAAPGTAREVTVEATDPWGTVYTERIAIPPA